MTPTPTPTSSFDLVIFDCDGVLVDSEHITGAVFAEMLGELGLTFTLDEMFATFRGRSMADCLEIVGARLGRPVGDDFYEQYDARILPELAARVEPIPGVERALAGMDVLSCVASNGSLSKMRTTLGRTGLLERFEGRLFSARETVRAKPHPDLFLHAAERLGADPARCAVVEDTEHGVQAGVAAKMTVFGYAQHTTPEHLAGAGAIVFDDMTELPQLLRAHAPAC